jgi:hypothetical protein
MEGLIRAGANLHYAGESTGIDRIINKSNMYLVLTLE